MNGQIYACTLLFNCRITTNDQNASCFLIIQFTKLGKEVKGQENKGEEVGNRSLGQQQGGEGEGKGE